MVGIVGSVGVCGSVVSRPLLWVVFLWVSVVVVLFEFVVESDASSLVILSDSLESRLSVNDLAI